MTAGVASRLKGDNAYAFKDVRDEVGTTLTEDQSIDTFTPPADGDVPPSSGSDWLYPNLPVADARSFCPAAVFRTARLSIGARDRRRLRQHSIKTRLRAQVVNPRPNPHDEQAVADPAVQESLTPVTPGPRAPGDP